MMGFTIVSELHFSSSGRSPSLTSQFLWRLVDVTLSLHSHRYRSLSVSLSRSPDFFSSELWINLDNQCFLYISLWSHATDSLLFQIRNYGNILTVTIFLSFVFRKAHVHGGNLVMNFKLLFVPHNFLQFHSICIKLSCILHMRGHLAG